jgi:hypothetical protein
MIKTASSVGGPPPENQPPEKDYRSMGEWLSVCVFSWLISGWEVVIIWGIGGGYVDVGRDVVSLCVCV